MHYISKTDSHDWIACSDCDVLHPVIDIPAGNKAVCSRCGSELYRHVKNSIDKVVAFAVSALLFLILSHIFPFLTMQLGGRSEQNILLSATLELMEQGFYELAVLVFVTSILAPILVIIGMLYIYVPLKLGHQAWAVHKVFRYVKKLLPWSLIGVFMLGVLIAIVKLMDMASVIPGISLFSMIGLLITMVAINANLDERIIWGQSSLLHDHDLSDVDGYDHDMISCHCCQLLMDKKYESFSCPRCNEKLHFRKSNSIARTWALLLTAAMLYIPANVYPIMTFINFGQGQPDTIMSGVNSLIDSGFWGLALLVFVASILVPVIKLMVLAYLLLSIQFSSCWRPKDRTVLFRITEFIGVWSMLDIFLIGILISLVKLDALATIEVETGASYFAAVVVITLFAARSFEPRMIWDKCKDKYESK